MEHDRLLGLIRRFADANDECCLARLVGDYPDETAHLMPALSPEHRTIVSRLMNERRASCGA
jgi:hypothetical protein